MKPHEILDEQIKEEVRKQATAYADRCGRTQEEKSLAYSAYITGAESVVKFISSNFHVIRSRYTITAQDGMNKFHCDKCSEQLIGK